MRSLVTSIFLYACELWTLTAELQRRIRAMEMRCYRKILRISCKDYVVFKNMKMTSELSSAVRVPDILRVAGSKTVYCLPSLQQSQSKCETAQFPNACGIGAREMQAMDLRSKCGGFLYRPLFANFSGYPRIRLI